MSSDELKEFELASDARKRDIEELKALKETQAFILNRKLKKIRKDDRDTLDIKEGPEKPW